MSSLSEQLKALGVRVGTQNIQQPEKRNSYSIESILPGRFIRNMYGESFVVESIFPHNHQHGEIQLKLNSPPDILASWVGEPALITSQAEEFIFLDTETTGLTGNANTHAFMIGVGRFIGGEFKLAQFFMRHPGEELAHLAALLEFIGDAHILVTFNGKGFDIPVLTNRYLVQGLGSPFKGMPNIDLLQLARKLWRERLPSRTLIDIEAQILGFTRTEEDIPSWVIPQLYYDYLRTNDARLIKNVFYHNAKDVLSMVTLYNYITRLLLTDLTSGVLPEFVINDIIGIGKIYESMGHLQEAVAIYRQSLVSGLDKTSHFKILEKLASIYKHLGDWSNAIELWDQAAAVGQIYAYIELAKYYEHRKRDISMALRCTQLALEQINHIHPKSTVDLIKIDELKYRLNRLTRKTQSTNHQELQ